MKPCCLILLLLLGASAWLSAQDTPGSAYRVRDLRVSSDSMQIDSLPIFPSSLRLFSLPAKQHLDSSLYKTYGNKLILSPVLRSRYDSLRVVYRRLPPLLTQKSQRIDSSLLVASADTSPTLLFNPYQKENDPFALGGLNYSGVLARGISFGNRQDLVLNSSFNLQLSGDLGNGIQIKAALTDENLPLQPEGNTQQLRSFDQVYVSIKKDNTELTAGDYELRNPENYFARYFKKLQGATVRNTAELGKGQLSSSASAAIARGKFARNVLDPIEGNQGPYQLRGAQNERFIVVLAGTEQVFLDGQLLTRGIEQDYVIDYNRGTITFTNKRLIRRETRIIVEFDYADQQFTRSLFSAQTAYQSDRLRLYAHFFGQQDSRNPTDNLQLSDADRRQLNVAGDDLSKAVISGLRPEEEFSPARVSYRLVDTTGPCGFRDSVLVFAEAPTANLVRASFSFVGPGNGHYRRLDNGQANEVIYEYVAPDPNSCTPQGDFAPVIQLTPPQQEQIVNLGAAWKLDERSELQAEVAFSNTDLNRLSQLDNADDQGTALFAAFQRKLLDSSRTDGHQLNARFNYEYKAADFTAPSNYRDPEFLRDWSLAGFNGQGTTVNREEQLLRSELQWRTSRGNSLSYGFSAFLRDSLYQGQKHIVRSDWQWGSWSLRSNSSYLLAQLPAEQRTFLRPQASLTKRFPQLNNWELQASYEGERNARTDNAADTLTQQSFSFNQYRAALSNPADASQQIALFYQLREDFLPEGRDFRARLRAEEAGIEANWSPASGLRLDGNFTYRQLRADEEEDEETLLGRLNGQFNLLGGIVRANSTYELGTGQEPRRAFTYIQVARGEGVYIWLDSLYNNDGIIQPNEMEIAPFPDQADYVRVATITDDFVQTNFIVFNQSLQLNPKAKWFDAEQGLKKLLTNFSTQSSLRISRRSAEAGGLDFNPFRLDIADSSLIALNSSMRHVLFVRRGDPTLDAQIAYNDNRSKLLQNAGFESRSNRSLALRLRYNFSQAWSLRLNQSIEEQVSDSQLFNQRDFSIQSIASQPELDWIPSPRFRAQVNYRLKLDQNLLGMQGEEAISHRLGIEANYSGAKQSTLRSSFSYVSIDFSGESSSPVGFAILNGLQNGRNLLWELSWDQQITRNLRLRLSYNGRQTGNGPLVHVGNAQVAAIF